MKVPSWRQSWGPRAGGQAAGKAGSSVTLEANYLYRAGGQAGDKAGGHELEAKLEVKLGLP